MSIELDHLIVPVRDRVAAATFLARLLDVPWAESQGAFTPVFVNEGLTVDFASRERFESHHYCFRVGDGTFDAILGRLRGAEVPYRSTPRGETDMRINERLGGRGVYWEDPDGHLWEVLTVSYARPAGSGVAPAGTSTA